MQVDHINENTIRVRIDKDELARRGLKVLDLLGDKGKIQRFFYSILEEVDTDHTFTKDTPVTFQVMPNNGGLDLLITKVQPNSAPTDLRHLMNTNTNQTQAQPDSRRSFFDLDPKDDTNTDIDPAVVKKAGAHTAATDSYWKFQRRHAYSFNDLGDLIELADSLRVSDLASSLYYLRGHYYLELAFLDDNYAELKPVDAWAIANEYGIKIEPNEMKIIKQRGKCLLGQDALGNLRHYFLTKTK